MNSQPSAVNFNPTIEMSNRMRNAILAGETDSFKISIPTTAAPSAPIPTQMA